MKHGLIYMILIFSLINNAHAEEPSIHVSIFKESMENGSAASLAIYGGNVFYGGLSLNYISSSTVIQFGNRKTIAPVYLFLGIKAPWKLSPYFEAGLDLPEAIIDDLFNNEEDAISLTDYYYSGGLKLYVGNKLSFSLYVKRYNFIFRDSSISPIIKTRPSSYGVGVTIHF